VARSRTRLVPWLVLVAIYAIFFWRSFYSQQSFALRLLDWIVPVAGLGLWAAMRWRRGAGWPRTHLDYPLLAWCLVTAVMALFSINSRVSLQWTWTVCLIALIFWLLVDALRRGWGAALWRMLYLAAGVVCLIGIIEFLAWYFGWPLLSEFQQGWFEIGGLAQPIPPAMRRIGLGLSNITALSAFLALLIPPAISIAVTTRDRDARWGMGLWLVAALAVEGLSGSRGGFLALGVSLSLIALASLRSPQFGRLWARLRGRQRQILLVSASVAMIVIVGAGATLILRMSQASGHISADVERRDMWRSAAAMFRYHPLTGIGPGAYGTGLRVYRDPLLARDHFATAHNVYLNTAAEMGILGVVAGGWLVLALAWRWWQRWRGLQPGTAPWWRVLGIGAALAGLAAQCMVDTFVESAILIPVAFLVATIVAPARPASSRPGRAGRWLWAATLGLLAIGALGMAWDDWGYGTFVRSLTWIGQGEVEQAAAAVERARDHDPGMSLYACQAGYLYGRQAADGHPEALPLALEAYQECTAAVPVPNWVDQLNYAALLWQSGQPDQALALARTTTHQNPLVVVPWLSRGLWAEMRSSRSESVEAYGWALALNPGLAGSPFWRQGERADRWNDILAAGQQAIARLGRSTAVWRWQALSAYGEKENVTLEIEAWLTDHPTDTEAMSLLGQTLLQLGQPQEAFPWLDRSLSVGPASAHGFLLRGEAALALGQSAQAECDLRTSLFLNASDRARRDLTQLTQQMGIGETTSEEEDEATSSVALMQGAYLVLYNRLGWPVVLPQVPQIGAQ
jgi:tetratricopeptide (TPR) repeat protein